MNSKNLIEEGFCDWLSLNNVTQSNLPPDQGVVIAIANKELAGKPQSDILYIGRTKKPAKRLLGGYLAGYGGKNTRRINNLLFKEGYLEKVTVSWVPAVNPRKTQKELLAQFKKESGELPAWNIKKNLHVKSKKARTRAPTAPVTPAYKAGAESATKKEEQLAPKTVKPLAVKPTTFKPKAAPEVTKKEETSPKMVEAPKPTTGGTSPS